MQSMPKLVTLVDVDGFDVPSTERADAPEPDPTDPENWPAWTDNWFWGITDEADLAELETEAAESMADLADAPQPSYADQLWAAMMAEGSLPALSGGAPEPFEPSSEDWADSRVHFDRGDREHCRGDEDAMLAGLPVG